MVSSASTRVPNDLVRESDPRSCIELITDWERVCGLPGECLADDSVASLQGRRAAVVNVLTRVGGQTPAFFKRLAAIAGVEIEIMEYRPFVAGLSRCGEPLSGPRRRAVLLDGDGSRSTCYILSVRFFILRGAAFGIRSGPGGRVPPPRGETGAYRPDRRIRIICFPKALSKTDFIPFHIMGASFFRKVPP